ncbi:MAG: hypothetical protein ACYTF0_00080 [Planctomycetota bacterium]|jgi:hypothetical protein
MGYAITIADEQRRLEVVFSGPVTVTQIIEQIREVHALGDRVRGYREVIRFEAGASLQLSAEDVDRIATDAAGHAAQNITDVRILVASPDLIEQIGGVLALMRARGIEVQASVLG